MSEVLKKETPELSKHVEIVYSLRFLDQIIAELDGLIEHLEGETHENRKIII